MPPESVILKYLKVKALAEQGIPGERDNAARAQARMERDHPEIQRYATAYKSRKEQAENGRAWPPSRPRHHGPGEPAPSPGWSFSGSNPSPFGGEWADVFRFVQQASQGVREAAARVAEVQSGTDLADENVNIRSRLGRNRDKVLVTFNIPIGALTKARDNLNILQKQAFKQALHDMLEDELDELLEEG